MLTYDDLKRLIREQLFEGFENDDDPHWDPLLDKPPSFMPADLPPLDDTVIIDPVADKSVQDE